MTERPSNKQMLPWLQLVIGVGLCLTLLVAVLAQPIQIRWKVQRYDQADAEDTTLRGELAAMGEKASPSIIERCLDPSCRNRIRLVHFLAEYAPEEAWHVFSQAAKDPNRSRQILAIESLGFLGQQAARPLLLRYIQSDQEQLSQIAKQALRNLENQTHRSQPAENNLPR